MNIATKIGNNSFFNSFRLKIIDSLAFAGLIKKVIKYSIIAPIKTDFLPQLGSETIFTHLTKEMVKYKPIRQPVLPLLMKELTSLPKISN